MSFQISKNAFTGYIVTEEGIKNYKKVRDNRS